MVENIVRRALYGVRSDPKRTIRNLVDLGLETSGGALHKRFMADAQNLLRREDSPYYDMVVQTVRHVDEERLLTFGLNLGWDGLTVGARRIRELEAQRGHNIPWSLTLHMATGGKLSTGDYLQLVQDGASLGIGTYFLMPADTDAVDMALDLALLSRGCAFFLFLPPGYPVETALKRLLLPRNLMLCLDCETSGWQRQAELLRDNHLLYGLWRPYATHDESIEITSGRWIKPVLPYAGLAVFLIGRGEAAQDPTASVCLYARDARLAQRYPALVFDFYLDALYLDVLISNDPCFAGFLPDGRMTQFLCGEERPAGGSILSEPLDRLLRCFAKARAAHR